MPVTFLTGASETKKEELIKKLLKDEKAEYIRIHPDDPDKLNFLRSIINTRTIFSTKPWWTSSISIRGALRNKSASLNS